MLTHESRHSLPWLICDVSRKIVNSFLAHIGERNAVDLDYTLAQRRSISDVIRKLPCGQERSYFESAGLRDAFPDGKFNVWGVPIGARAPFERTKRGDVVFFAPSVSRDGGCLLYAGVVKLAPRIDFPKASRILWPESGFVVYPHLFFLDAEAGVISWFDFMCDICYAPEWNPKGWYVRLDRPAYRGTRDPMAYLDYLRASHGFKKMG